MQSPLISILIPFKNTETYLTECLNSILQQSYSHWELIIIDDFSSDGSYQLVKKYADNDSRITLLKNASPGIIKALQLAFKHSKGEFITRMDSDDIMLPNKLEILANHLLQYGTGHVAIGQVSYFCETGVGNGYKSYETWLNQLTATGKNYTEIYKECVIPSPCWMLHRTDLANCDAFNPHVYPEDYDLTFRFYKHGYTCIPCDTVLHKWRDYSTRTSRTDDHYAENHFIPLKISYFLELDYNREKTLVLWGAGRKGKAIAKILVDKQVAFEWVCDNPNKIGHNIYGKTLKTFDTIRHIKHLQSIITVANKKEQAEIRAFFKALNLKPHVDYHFFC